MPDSVVLVDEYGQALEVPESEAAYFLAKGLTVETPEQKADRLAGEAKERAYGGVTGSAAALSLGALRGITLGASDIGLDAIGAGSEAQALREVNPIASTIGEVGGTIAGAAAAPGSLLARATPAGRLAGFAARVGEAIPGAGILARTGRLAATGATEGAISNAGQYLGSIALEDKDFSAQGFLASMKDGALYGGGAAGALGVAGEGLMAARRLLPETELTAAAAKRASRDAVQEVSRAIDDSRNLEAAARTRRRMLREEAIQRGAVTREELDRIAIEKAREVAQADIRRARANADAAEARAEAARARAERAKSPPARTRKAKGETSAAEAPQTTAPEPAVAGSATGGETASADDLMAQLVGTKAALDSGVELGALSARRIPPATGDDLMAQLQGTKAALDVGTSLSDLSSAGKADVIERAIDEHIATKLPEMERVLRHLDGLAEARNAVEAWVSKYPTGNVKAFEYAEGMRKKTGWRDVVPAGEGNIVLPRGRQGEFLGDEAARQSYERGVIRRDLRRRIEDPLASEAEREEARSILAQMDEESAARKAKQIVEPAPSVDEQIEKALEQHGDLAADTEDAAHAIGQLEQSMADLADEVGADVPPSAAQRAQQFREAQVRAERSAETAAAEATGDAERAAGLISTGDAPKKASRLLARASEAGQILEALEMLGVPVPSASRLPVVGPLLSLYLKAKLIGRAVNRFGGKVPRTAETEIARRSAEIKTRLIKATDRALAGAGRAVTTPTAARASAALAVTLFDDRDPATPEKKTTPKSDLGTLYLARKDELERAMAPGAVREAVRKRIRTADTDLLDAIAAAEEKRLTAIYEAMPKVERRGGILASSAPPVPARSEIERWAKTVDAINRPAETLEAILEGAIVDPKAAAIIREVYPRLVGEIGTRIVERAATEPVKMSYRRRIQLSTMLGIPLDDSQSPESAASLQQRYRSRPNPPAQGAPATAFDARIAERVDPETRT